MIEFIVEESGETRRVTVDAVPVHLGRAEEAEVSVINNRASRHHARVEQAGGEFVVIDLDSSNGTFVNDERIRRSRLKRGDKIEIGDAEVTFLGGDLEVVPVDVGYPQVKGLTILDEQGRGVLTQVLMARQDALGRKVAVKFLDRQWVGSKAIVTRFQRQTRQQSRLHHHGLASGIDVGTADGVPFFVVEYLEGDTVGARVRSAMTFDVVEGVRVLKELLEVIGWIHEQDHVVGSLHPESVVLGDAGEVWLTGLGFPLPSPRSYPDSHAHELLYLAPEGVAEPDDAGPRGDVFSVGAVAAFMFTGRAPRQAAASTADALAYAQAPPPREVLDGRKLPPPLKSWILRLLSEEPGDRPADGAAALAELGAVEHDILHGQATLARSAKVAEERSGDGSVPVRRSKRFIMLNRLLTVAIAIALNVGVFIWFTGRDKEEDPESEPRPDHPTVSASQNGGVQPAAVDDAEVAREYAAVTAQIDRLVAKDRFSEAYVTASAFGETYAASERWSPKGIELVSSLKQRQRDRATELLDELQALTKAGKLDDARAVLRKARPIAEDLESARLARLEDRLHDAWVARRRSAPKKPEGGAVADGPGSTKPDGSGSNKPEGSGKPEQGGTEVSPKKPEPRVARANWPKLVERALSRPAQHDLRKQLLELASKVEDPADLGDLAPRVRWLQAIDAAMTDLSSAWKAAIGRPIEIPLRKGDPASGVLEAVKKDKLVLQAEGATIEVSFDRVAPAAMLRMLSVLPPNLDRYLARARLAIAAREGEEAWFDLQGALVLSGDDAMARALAESELERLRRSPPRRRRQ